MIIDWVDGVAAQLPHTNQLTVWNWSTISIAVAPGSSDSQVLVSVRIFVAKNVNSKILPSKQVDSRVLVGLTRGEIL